LEAYVWPDQPARLQRLHRAADLALAAGAKVEEADAAEWLEHAVRLQAKEATVVYHSVFWQYPPEASRHRMRSAIEALAKASSDLAPFFWLRMEPSVSRPSGPMEVLLTAWPRGDERRLAAVHPHGAFVRWVGGRGAE
jgi:hypothetical protein